MKRFYYPALLCWLTVILTVTPALAKDWSSQFRDETNRNSVIEQPMPPFAKMGEVPNQLVRPVVEGNILITATADESGNMIVAYRLSTLTKLWEFRTGLLIPRQPTIHHGTVYFGVFSQPYLYAVGLVTGEYRWQRIIANETQALKFAPLGLNDSLFVVGKAIHKLSAETGFEDWNVPVVIDAPLGADDQFPYLRRHDQRISQLNVKTGAITWSVPTNTTFGTAPAVSGTTVYVGTFQKIFAIEKSTGLKRWEYSTTGPGIGNLALAGPSIFFSTNNGDITALDDTGHRLWINDFNNSSSGWQSEFLVAGNAVIAQADASRTIILNALTGAQIYLDQLPDSSAKVQAIVDHLLLAKTETAIMTYQAADWLVGTLGDPIIQKRIDPVIVVPGMIESWPVKGVWQLDPVFKMFDNLLSTFRAAGYTDDLTLFSFPYDWHKDNRETAALLAQKVAAVRAQTGAEKVDIVAHSMGGLVARSYIQSDSYQNDVDQLVTVAVPNHGSVKSYLTWEAAETGPGTVDRLKEALIAYEAKKKGYAGNKVGFIQSHVPSIGQLLPTFDYLKGDSNLKPYLPCADSEYPCNSFLESLNTQIDRLVSRVSVYNVIAQLKQATTLAQLLVEPSAAVGLWQHGMPRNYPSEEGFIYGVGDVTVLSSSAHIDGVPEKILTSDHGTVITDAASLIVKELSDRNVVIEPKSPPLRYLFVQLFSPITMLLSDKNGHQLGTLADGSIVNTIPDAYYSGKTEEGEYAIVPNPIDSDYQLSLTGTAEGDYSVTGALVEPEKTVQSTQSGMTALNKNEDYSVTVKPQEVIITPVVTPTPCVSPPP